MKDFKYAPELVEHKEKLDQHVMNVYHDLLVL